MALRALSDIFVASAVGTASFCVGSGVEKNEMVVNGRAAGAGRQAEGQRDQE